MLAKGDAVPHFDVRDLDGATVRYADIWQRRQLVLVVLPGAADEAGRAYAAELAVRLAAPGAPDAALVVTADAVASVPAPAGVGADRWGEVYLGAAGGVAGDLPAPVEVIEWATFVAHECPECQGEAK
jgi:hypothetical protein